MGTYSKKNGKKSSRGTKGFQYFEVKKSQYEREKQKTSSMATTISERNLEIKKARAKIQHLEEEISQLEYKLETAYIEIERLAGTVDVQRRIIEDMNERW